MLQKPGKLQPDSPLGSYSDFTLPLFIYYFCRSTWAQLQDQIKNRTKRLASAAEIHGFNRDLNDLITRLQEKDAALSMEDLGRDMASVQGLQRKHEGHERELLVVQQQVETLNAESGKLQAAYQGNVMLVFKALILWYVLQILWASGSGIRGPRVCRMTVMCNPRKTKLIIIIMPFYVNFHWFSR